MKKRPLLLTGLVLLWLGLYFLATRYFPIGGGPAILLVLSGIFLAVSAAADFRGPLLPAGVLGGLAAGLLLRNSRALPLPGWGAVVLGLGAGFLFVGGVDRWKKRQRHPSPVPPGVALLAVAAGAFLSRHAAFRRLFSLPAAQLWPWLLLGGGALLLLIALLERRA